MRFEKKVWLVGCVLLLASTVGAVRGDTIKKSGGLRIGVVDVGKIFEGYRKKIDREVELEKERNELQAEVDRMEKQLKKFQQEMKIYKGEKLEKKKAEYEDKLREYRAFIKVNNSKLQEKQTRLWKEVYNEIFQEVRRYGENNGYDLILQAGGDEVGGRSVEEVQLRVDMKKVIFFAPTVDVTGKILDILNARYKKMKEKNEKKEQ